MSQRSAVKEKVKSLGCDLFGKCSLGLSLVGIPALLLIIGITLSSAPVLASSLIHHEIVVDLDPDKGAIEIKDEFDWSSSQPISFQLAGWLRIEQASINGQPVSPKRVGDRWLLPGHIGPSRYIRLQLSGKPPGLEINNRKKTGGLGFVSPSGSYLPGYAAWIAYTGHPRINYQLQVKVPDTYRAVATGRLSEEHLEGGKYSATFISGDPVELPSLFAGPYVISEIMDADIRLRTYFNPEQKALADSYLATSANYIRKFAARIGAYPFKDFHIVSAPIPVGLGFPNMTYVSQRILHLPFMKGQSLAHEIMHNWWGNGVGVNYASGNWAEGLTTYLADYALAEANGPSAAREMRLRWLQAYGALSKENDLPVNRFISNTHDRAQTIGYNKVSFIFHMLRQLIGDKAFDAGLQKLWRDKKFQTASWTDILRVFESTASTNLDAFFVQWITRPGAPVIKLQKVERVVEGDQFTVSLTLSQSSPLFSFKVPVTIETAMGSTVQFIQFDDDVLAVSLVSKERPLAVHIDKNFDTFRRLLPREAPQVFRDVTLSSKTIVVSPGTDSETRQIAEQLASRLLERRTVIQTDTKNPLPSDVPVIFIGTTKNYQHWRQQMNFVANDISQAGTARAWVQPGKDNNPVFFIIGETVEALRQVMRPLPHYRNHGFLVFEGRKVVQKGVWPTLDSPLSMRF